VSAPCPAGCGRQKQSGLFACRTCWFRLPKDLRDPINHTWRSGDLDGWLAASEDALRWYLDNPATS